MKELAQAGSVDAFDSSQWGTIKGKTIPLPINKKQEPTPSAEFVDNIGYGGYNRVFVLNYDGEKDLGEMGPIRKYIIDHVALRLRSWQLYLESDVCQALFTRSAIWGIGTGLKLQAEPIVKVLAKNKITVKSEDFNEEVEEFFQLFANSTMSDYQGLRTLHEIANEAWINDDVGGDVLLVMRLIDGLPKAQLIDGAHLKTPLNFGTSTGIDIINPVTKNRIRHGVEKDDTGRHVAYWVCKINSIGEFFNDFERIEARMSKYPYSEMARLVYGSKYRLDNDRGIPLISAVMETAAKMGRYREASLGSAEERAKVVYTINHGKASTGENPAISQISKAAGFSPQSDLPADSLGNALADKVQATTNKQTFNMPIDSAMETLDSKQELNFKDFYTINFDLVCAVAGYPPEVIMSKYDSNYSASRAAIKDFEHTLNVKRARFAKQFYQLVYNFWLDVNCLNGSIDAPGYLNALLTRNTIALEAYRNAEWEGDTVPHIDPYKEVQAIRAMLGEDSANFPLITMEQAVKMLPGHVSQKAVVEQYAGEVEAGEELGIEKVLPRGASLEGAPGTAPNGNPKPNK